MSLETPTNDLKLQEQEASKAEEPQEPQETSAPDDTTADSKQTWQVTFFPAASSRHSCIGYTTDESLAKKIDQDPKCVARPLEEHFGPKYEAKTGRWNDKHHATENLVVFWKEVKAKEAQAAAAEATASMK